MFISFSFPGPRADRGFKPTSLAIGPLTTRIGACGLVDISKDLPPWAPISDKHFTPAIIIGMCSGFAPARAEFIAIFSTVATPKPGGISHTISSDFRPVPEIKSATASSVAGYKGRASDHSLLLNSAFIFKTASYLSSPSNRILDSSSSSVTDEIPSDVRQAIRSSMASSVCETHRSSARLR